MKNMYDTALIMSHDIFCKIFKNCCKKENFSVFLQIENEDIPREYQELVKHIKHLVNKKITINSVNLFNYCKNFQILEKYIGLCNYIDKQIYGIL